MESNNKKNIRLHIEGMEYPIDQDTATKLQEGIIPKVLQQQITQTQGSSCVAHTRRTGFDLSYLHGSDSNPGKDGNRKRINKFDWLCSHWKKTKPLTS